MSDTPLTDAAKEGGESWMELAALSAQLERENAALRKDVYCCPPTTENDYEGFKWKDSHEELEHENAALREDKARLDWLDVNPVDRMVRVEYHWVRNDDDATVRAAIDAARKEAQP